MTVVGNMMKTSQRGAMNVSTIRTSNTNEYIKPMMLKNITRNNQPPAGEDMKCQHCGKEGAEKRRQNTAYADDEWNFAILCDECQEESHKYWQERWDDYYSEVM